MRQSMKERANKILGDMGKNIPKESICACGWWGEIELPDCLRAELEASDEAQQTSER